MEGGGGGGKAFHPLGFCVRRVKKRKERFLLFLLLFLMGGLG